ncbi:prestalk protein-like [Armigeres subalbatus]|uniref:prestalk protein-like n=1 Tax=Armigeres subalbatus TaxID=124917 RepID=UPI002ED1F420
MASWRDVQIFVLISVLLPVGVFPQLSTYSNKTCNLSDGRDGLCVYAYLCQDNVINVDGTGIVDLRFSDDCDDYILKCCSPETPCADSKGTCVAANRCSADLNNSKYRLFEEADECEWSGYKCCPNEILRKVDSKATECAGDSVCVPSSQCLVQPNGRSLSNARTKVCSSLETCCPRSQLKTSSSSPCEQIGGKCVPQNQCSSVFSVDIRIQSCDDPDLECCMSSNSTTSIRKACVQNSGKCSARKDCKGTVYRDRLNECEGLVCCASTESPPTIVTPPATVDKACFNNNGKCTLKSECKGTVYRDRHNECNGLVCCASQGTTDPTTPRPTQRPVTPGKSCFNNGGKCVTRKDCKGTVYKDRLNECEGLVCCASSTPTESPPTVVTPPATVDKVCFNNNGKCTLRSECKGTVYRDRNNECNGLVCCASQGTTDPTTPRPTQRPVTPGKSCFNNGGKCVTRKDCKGTVYRDRNNDCEGLVCCAVEPARTCSSLKGTCIAEQNCRRKSPTRVEDCSANTVCCLEVETVEVKDCGYRNENGIKFDTINRNDGESQYGEFPWMVAILTNEGNERKYYCGGSLIHPAVVLTSAGCVKTYRRTVNDLTVRAGEWDMSSVGEPTPYQERQVAKIVSHSNFHPNTLANNVALVFLDDAFDLSPTVNTVCLPPQNFEFDNGAVTASGWGTTPQNRTNHQHILKSIDLPLMPKSDCERTLQKATSNRSFKLHSSFLCAGGVAGVDTCSGDAGSPVILHIPNDAEFRYYAVGMVSWGVGCGRRGTPAVYTDIGVFRDWIDDEMEQEGFDINYYRYQLYEN